MKMQELNNNEANNVSWISFTKGVCLIMWTNDIAHSPSEQPYFIAWMLSKWIDGSVHADLTPWLSCEIDVDSIWFKCVHKALTLSILITWISNSQCKCSIKRYAMKLSSLLSCFCKKTALNPNDHASAKTTAWKFATKSVRIGLAASDSLIPSNAFCSGSLHTHTVSLSGVSWGGL